MGTNVTLECGSNSWRNVRWLHDIDIIGSGCTSFNPDYIAIHADDYSCNMMALARGHVYGPYSCFAEGYKHVEASVILIGNLE